MLLLEKCFECGGVADDGAFIDSAQAFIFRVIAGGAISTAEPTTYEVQS